MTAPPSDVTVPPRALPDDDVDELAAGVDHLDRLAARQGCDHLGPRQDQPLQLRLRDPNGTVTRSRSLPLTWTGTSRSLSAAAVSSTSGQGWAWIGRPRLSARLGQPRPQLLGDVRRRRRQQQEQQQDGLVPGSAAGRLSAAVALKQVRQLHEMRDHRVEAQLGVLL